MSFIQRCLRLGSVLFLVAATGAALVPAAHAGPNLGGTLVITQTQVVSCFDGSGEGEYCGDSDLIQCEDADVRHDGVATILLHVLAAFLEGSSPRLSGVVFGIEYGSAIFIVALGACGDFELPTTSWPASGEGTAVTWDTAETGQLTEIYWFGAYNYYGTPQTFALTAHPEQGAFFADDDVPSNIDPIADLGIFGFSTDGYVSCPVKGAVGACCLPDCDCIIVSVGDCYAQGGTYEGNGTTCDPDPCECPPEGACCLRDGSCIFVTEEDCSHAGGQYQGDDVSCEAVVCVPNPIGACCYPDGSCYVITEEECSGVGGQYQGDNVPCEDVDCVSSPTGACCFSDCSCFVLTQQECLGAEGSYYGDDVACEPLPCECSPGACCLPDGSCLVLTPPECYAEGGYFLGGESCEGIECSTPNIESSWGSIKARYRD